MSGLDISPASGQSGLTLPKNADAVSQGYKGPAKFKGGTILFVGVTVEKAQYLDLELLAAGALARD